MPKFPSLQSKLRSKGGFALLAALAFVLLLTILIISYISFMKLNGLSTVSFSRSVQAQEVAKGGLQDIIYDLHQQIVAGSIVDPGGIYTQGTPTTTTIYVPNSNLTAVPARLGYTAASWAYGPTSVPAAAPATLMTSLVQVSRADPAGGSSLYPPLTGATFPNLAALPNSTILNRASEASTGTASVNGRYISAARWNMPYLLASSTALIPKPFYDGETLPTAAYPGTPDLPDWVYVTRTGSQVCTTKEAQTGALSASSAANSNVANTTTPSSTTPGAVIGRYAFVIYDEGALLDANVAGSPSTLMNQSVVAATTTSIPTYINPSTASTPTPADLTFNGKSYLSFADLMQLPGFVGGGTQAQAQIDALVNRRNAAGMANNVTASNSYLAGVFNYALDGFLDFESNGSGTVSDSPFLDRQDLIKYFANIDTNINTTSATYSQALPYLGTFSRAVSAPSYYPPLNPSAIPGYVATMVSASPAPTYRTSMNTTGIANRDLPNVRFTVASTVTHYNDNQSSATPTATYQVNVGDPLLQNRFSFARIGWLSSQTIGGADPNGANPATGTGPSAPYATAIQACFGLKWGPVGGAIANGGNPCWLYIGSPAGTGGNAAAFNGTIETLDQVAKEGREPNFFELLKAAILSGSVGVSPGPAGWNNGIGFPSTTETPFSFKDTGLYAGGTDSLDAFSFDRVAIGSTPKYPAPGSIPDIQIIKIGADIIDQYDADSYPTAIYFPYAQIAGSNYDAKNFTEESGGVGAAAGDISGPSDMVYGDENLPSLQGVYQNTGTSTASGNTLEGWYQPEIWNPHQAPSKNTLTTIQNNTIPSSFKIRGYGQAFVFWEDGTPPGPTMGHTTQPFLDNDSIVFTDPSPPTSVFYPHPVVLTTALGLTVSAVGTDSANMAPTTMANYSSNPFIGFYMGEDGTYVPTPSSDISDEVQSRAQTNAGVTFCLGWTSGGAFHPYSYLCQLAGYSYSVLGENDGGDTEHGSAGVYGLPGNGDDEWHVYMDPRTFRFSQLAGWQSDFFNTTIYPATGTPGTDNYGQGRPVGTNVNSFKYFPGAFGDYEDAWMQNSQSPSGGAGFPANATYYADPDGVVRPGDGQFGNATTGDGMFTFTSAATPTGSPVATGDAGGNIQHGRRPVILNRPFRSLGELGYVFRDLPFKTLDFFSASSADAALLDVFSLTDESKVSSNQLTSVVAGKVDLSNAPLPVIQAILAGGSKKDFDPTYNLGSESGNSTEMGLPVLTTLATDFASNLNPATPAAGQGPLLNRAAIVTQIVSGLQYTKNVITVIGGFNHTTPTAETPYANSGDEANKAYLESPVRAVADITNTRTWNLLIDIIAQSGQIASNATKLDNFNVQGERRYWLHVAIDRYTGKIVAQHLEPVHE